MLAETNASELNVVLHILQALPDLIGPNLW
jgi:hypothetical protein